jgi:pimeloyl-ACP methyl ester carboxylesterase
MKAVQAFLPALLPLVSGYFIDYDFPEGTTEPTPFTISVNKALIDQAIAKARLYRPSNDLKDDSNALALEGPPRDLMVDIAKYWSEEYDWFELQEEINNNFSHYALTVPGSEGFDHPVPLHFVHEPSSSPDAIPLLLLHGWPSTHLEWSQVIKPLAHPENPDDQAFHIVAPDLPGFGFSPAPDYSGLSPKELGYAFDKLMQTLGYSKYGVVSTDLGWFVGLWMGDAVPDSLVGHFTDFWLQEPTAEDLQRQAANKTSTEENEYITSIQAFFEGHSGYLEVHRQNPLKIGQAMADTPVGFAGWIWHLTNAGVDGYQYTLKQIIDRTMALWIPGPWNGIRAYRECFAAIDFPKTTVPTGFSRYYNKGNPFKELGAFQITPRSWVERFVNLVFLKTHEEGGHFPAEKVPEVWMADVREFFGGLA